MWTAYIIIMSLLGPHVEMVTKRNEFVKEAKPVFKSWVARQWCQIDGAEDA